MYIHTIISLSIYIYIYTYTIYVCSLSLYIYIYIHIYIYMYHGRAAPKPLRRLPVLLPPPLPHEVFKDRLPFLPETLFSKPNKGASKKGRIE